MRRVGLFILALAFVVLASGCGRMVFNVSEPQAAQVSFKHNYVFWHSWDKKPAALPATINLQSDTWWNPWPYRWYIMRISDIPLQKGTVIYGRLMTFGNTEFSVAGQVPLVVSAQDVEDVKRGNVVRIVIVDPKKEYQTARFVQLRLSPTEDAMKAAKNIGEPLALVVLGNREPRYLDLY